MGKHKLKPQRPVLVKPDNNPLDNSGNVMLPATMLPSFRSAIAIEKGVEKNLLFKTSGGMGDVICAEPSIRYAVNNFHDCTISVASDFPEFFRHLNVKVFDLKKEEPSLEDFFVFKTIFPREHLQIDFMSPTLTHCVDYTSLAMFRCQLPSLDKVVQLHPNEEEKKAVENIDVENSVFIHAGKHWPSNTFPSDWWNEIIYSIQKSGKTPVLIGKEISKEQGTVTVDSKNTLDLRNKLKVMETVALLQKAKVFITSDSGPLHMAVTGQAHIAFLATAKHHELVTHWRDCGNHEDGSKRDPMFGWRMKNFSLGGAWQLDHVCPNKKQDTRRDEHQGKLMSWLPTPATIAHWALQHFD